MVKYIVDSTFGLDKAFAEANGISVVDLTLTLNGREYKDGAREKWNEFYSLYASSKGAAKTSQPSPRCFMDAIDAAIRDDPTADIIIFTIGDRLSGTIGSARIAAMQYPDRNVTAIDSHNGGASGLIFLKEMLAARKSGMDHEKLVEYAHCVRDRFCTLFIPATLTELARGGRVNKLLSRLGNILNIKPVFEYKANDVNIIGRVMGVKRALQHAVDALPDKPEDLSIMYIYNDGLVPTLRQKLKDRYGDIDIEVLPVCPVGGVNMGIGTVGIAYFDRCEQTDPAVRAASGKRKYNFV